MSSNNWRLNDFLINRQTLMKGLSKKPSTALVNYCWCRKFEHSEHIFHHTEFLAVNWQLTLFVTMGRPLVKLQTKSKPLTERIALQKFTEMNNLAAESPMRCVSVWSAMAIQWRLLPKQYMTFCGTMNQLVL